MRLENVRSEVVTHITGEPVTVLYVKKGIILIPFSKKSSRLRFDVIIFNFTIERYSKVSRNYIQGWS